MNGEKIINNAIEKGEGILRLAPNWVPRKYSRPGRRLKLNPNDYFGYGIKRGAITERWLSSATKALNGKNNSKNEGLSYISTYENKKTTLLEAIEHLKKDLIGENLWKKYGRWSMFAKLFDNMGPLQLHIHQQEKETKKVGMFPKPEMYFFPSQVNPHFGNVPYTFLGIRKNVSKEDFKNALKEYGKGNNNILEFSQGYKLSLDTGFNVPAGILHAPGSLCTYEPQFASDVSLTVESVLYGDHPLSENMLWSCMPKEEIGNYDYIIEAIDWKSNSDPDIFVNTFMKPIEIKNDMPEVYKEQWICYKSDIACAKKLTVYPSQTATIKDPSPYGLISIQGYGKLGKMNIETPSIINFGENTNDEYFVSEYAAKRGVKITNISNVENLVILKHFAEHNEKPKSY